MRIKENLGSIVSSTNRNKSSNTIPKAQVGKVFGIITTENTPTKELFEKYGGWAGIGTIFYKDYDQSKFAESADLNLCKVAKPLYSNIQDYPLIGELVHIIDAPTAASQVANTQTQKYYTGIINAWNNIQQNAPASDFFGKTFIENADIRSLIYFEGDRIYQGRKGNGIRFGSTVKYHANLNEWSSIGNDGDPITIMINGYVTNDTGSLSHNIEEINKEKSSIYLTSTQLIPLLPDRSDNLNPLTQPFPPNKYLFSQLIMNSDRITLNSKKDEVMIFAKTNVEVSTKNIINLNAGNRVHLNSPVIFLGTKKDGTAPTEPLLLGNKTTKLLTDLMAALSELGNALTSIVTTPQGSPLTGVNTAGTKLTQKIQALQKQLKNITSTSNYTI
jgi:ACT domain-containing protein